MQEVEQRGVGCVCVEGEIVDVQVTGRLRVEVDVFVLPLGEGLVSGGSRERFCGVRAPAATVPAICPWAQGPRPPV